MEMSVASASEDVSGTGNAASPLRGVYRPLDEGEIRLIHLYPQGADEAINFQLRTYHLEASNLPFFEAVSYTWGERKIRHEAICNQFWPMGLHDNVAKILMKLRRLSTPRYVSILDLLILWLCRKTLV